MTLHVPKRNGIHCLVEVATVRAWTKMDQERGANGLPPLNPATECRAFIYGGREAQQRLNGDACAGCSRDIWDGTDMSGQK